MYPFIKKPNVLMKVYYFVLHRVTDGRNQCCTFFTTGRCASTSVGAYVRDDGDRRQTTKTKDTHAKTKYWINGVWCISVQVRGKCVSTSSTSTVVVHYQQWYPKTRLEWSTSLCRKKKVCSGSVSFIDITVQVNLSMDVPTTLTLQWMLDGQQSTVYQPALAFCCILNFRFYQLIPM